MAYVDQTKKQAIAAALKLVVPAGWKYSLAVRNHLSICLTISAAPVDLIAEVNRVSSERAAHRGDQRHPVTGSAQLNDHHPESFADGALLETFRKIIAALNTGNHDNSDIMTDYFDVGHYVDLQVGRWDRPFVCTAAAVAEA